VFKASTNGVVERFHRTLNSMLAKVVNDNQRNWDECVPYVMAAYRATPHKSTGYSPNRLFLGHEVRMPLDVVISLSAEHSTLHESPHGYLAQLHQHTSEAYALARRRLRACAEQRKKYFDLRVRPEKFSVGDWVFYHYHRRLQSRSLKWQKAYTGPFLIVRMIEPSNCVLQKTPKSKGFVAHFDKLKKCYEDSPESWVPHSVE